MIGQATLAMGVSTVDPKGNGHDAARSCQTNLVVGRLSLDEPTDVPEGTVLHVVADDAGDDLDQTDRDALNAAISTSLAQAGAGCFAPAREILEKLRARRRG